MRTKKYKQSILAVALAAAMAAMPLPSAAWAAEEAAPANGAPVSTEDTTAVQVTYKTITEGFDWGPAVTKVVLDVQQNLDSKAVIGKDTFTVSVVKKEAGSDKVVSEGAREVTDAYVSDASGNKAESGSYVTIEMAVGPTLSIGSPFYEVDIKVNTISKFADCEYTITQTKAFTAADDQTVDKLVGTPAAYDAKSSIIPICDDFDVTGVFNYKDAEFGDITLHYASYAPAEDSKKNPLIVWLHGAGEGGTDARVPLIGNKVVNLAADEIQGYFEGAYILAPQSDTMWMNNGIDGYTSDGTSMYTSALMECIKNYVDNNSDVDTDRIYIGGCSNGGYMTMNMITTYPDYFAAAFPTCEAYRNDWLTDEKVNAIKDMPLWFTHAYNDEIVAISEIEDSETWPPKFKKDENGNFISNGNFSIAAVERLRAAGGENIHISLFDDVHDTTGKYFAEDGTPHQYMGHFSWLYVLNNQCVENIGGQNVTIMEWLAVQKRSVSKPETAITVKKDKLTVKKGKTVKIKAAAANADGQKITYKSKNKKIATVNAKGVVRGVKKGSTKIVVKCNGVTKTVKVTVQK